MSGQFSYREWGYWRVIEERPGYKIKELVVKPGGSLSKQYHLHRDEYWIVLEGIGEVLLDDPVFVHDDSGVFLSAGKYLRIHKHVIHQLKNLGDVPLVILETQVGEKCIEEDIVRLD